MSSLKYASAADRARLAVGALCVMVVLDAISIGSLYLQYDLVGQLSGPNPPTEAALTANDERERLIGLTYLGVYLVTIVLFLRWLHRVVANVAPLGGRTEWSPGWAVGYWFIPIVNLFRPYQVVDNAWSESSPAAGPAGAGGIIGTWWGLWVGGNVLSNIVFRMNPDSVEGFQQMTMLSIFASLLSLGAGIMCVRVVRRLTARQDERARNGGVGAVFT